MTTLALNALPAATDNGPTHRDTHRLYRYRMIQLGLFTVGAILMPAGVMAVGLGWWGAAHRRYLYDQFPYLLSGGLLGVCLTTFGGFLYFGAWQAKVASDQRQALTHLSESIQVLAEAMAW